MHEDYKERDELRARFTVWLEWRLQREREHYLHKAEKEVPPMPPEEINLLSVEDISRDISTEFDFEEERLAKAFARLSPKRQDVLTMLYAQDLKPHEVAAAWNTTPEYIYKLRYRAISELRKALDKEGYI